MEDERIATEQKFERKIDIITREASRREYEMTLEEQKDLVSQVWDLEPTWILEALGFRVLGFRVQVRHLEPTWILEALGFRVLGFRYGTLNQHGYWWL